MQNISPLSKYLQTSYLFQIQFSESKTFIISHALDIGEITLIRFPVFYLEKCNIFGIYFVIVLPENYTNSMIINFELSTGNHSPFILEYSKLIFQS